jgi:hypothetical protein
LYAAPPVSSVRLALFAVLAVLAGSGCRAKIGDACRRSTDCSVRGDRTCDLSHRVNDAGIPTPSGRGECTIEGCGHDSCPKEGACVKVYGADFLTIACDPIREDIATWNDPDRCDVPEDDRPDSCVAQPPLDLCEPHEVCLPEGLCADELTARTSCRRKCGEDDDCRNGYECVRTGARGVYRAPDLSKPGQRTEVDICMPEA